MSGTRTYGGQTAQQRADVRRAAFLDAGLELFGTRAYRQVTVGDLASESGQTLRAFYELFANREVFVGELDRHLAGELTAAVISAAGPPPLSWPAIERVLDTVLGFYAEDPRRAHVQLVAVAGVSPEMEQLRRANIYTGSAIVGDLLGDRAGPTPAARRRAAIAFSGAFNSLLMTCLLDQEDTIEDVRAELITQLRTRFFADV